MATGDAAGVSEALARALCEFATLPVGDERFGILGQTLQSVLDGRRALATLDLSHVEPVAAFDARWE